MTKHIRVGIVLLVTFVLGAGLFVMSRVDSVDSRWFPKCILYRVTGLHCPGCGATRALHAIVHGRVVEAIRFNPLLVLGLPVILAAISYQRHCERRGENAWPWFAWVLFGLLVAYTLARNLPSPSRGWLAPPAGVNRVTESG